MIAKETSRWSGLKGRCVNACLRVSVCVRHRERERERERESYNTYSIHIFNSVQSFSFKWNI